VIPETGVSTVSGVLRFYSLSDVRRYLKGLLDTYQKEYDKSSNVIGSLLRSEGGKSMEVIMSKGWAKVGNLFVNLTDSERGTMEVVFQIVEEMKPRVAKTEAVLRSFDTVEGLPIPEDATFLLYLRGGVPERLIVDTVETKPQKFLLNGKFRIE
jgi:DNA replication initiation complex subunit (GINS family)